jgi:outer membrane biosynthesis protein TonB
MSGCWFWKKAAPKIPAPVPAVQPVAAQAAPPPVVENAAPAATPTLVPTPKETPTPKPAVRSNPVPAPPPPAPTATPVAPVGPPPPLREIISGEQRRQYETEFSKGVARASAALKQASTRTLNASQQETAAPFGLSLRRRRRCRITISRQRYSWRAGRICWGRNF